MKMASEVDPHPGRVSEQEFMSPKLGFSMAAELESYLEKSSGGVSFSSRQIYSPKGEQRQGRRTCATDNPQEQGITVAPLNVEVRYLSAGTRRKSYLFLQLKCHKF